MPEQIVFEIETNPVDIIQDVYDYLQLNIPGWEPSEGNLDVWMIEAFAQVAADIRDLASQVPPSIYRYFGASLAGIPPIEAAPATTTTTWTAIDTAGHTILAGTLVGIRNAAGDLVAFETVNEVTIIPGQSVTAVGAVTISAVEPGLGTSGLGGVTSPIELIDPLEWVSGITTVTATTGGIDAEDDDTYLSRLRGQLQLMAPRPILARDFAIMARNIAGVGRSTAIDGYNPLHNLLTANQAGIETDASGWAVETNCTIARSTAQAMSGAASLAMTAVAAGDMTAKSTPAQAVVPGEFWTGLVAFRAATVARQCNPTLRWYSDVGGTALISSSVVNGADITTGWTQIPVTGIAPAGAKSMRLMAWISAAGGAGEVHYIDEMSIRRGTGSDWVPGNTPDLNNERMVGVSVTDINGAALSSTIKGAVQTYLDGLREANFVVSVVDPSFVSIAVTVTVKAQAGYSTTSLQASVLAAIQTYLSPATWGMPADGDQSEWDNTTTLRYLELATAINGVTGVDYITTTGGNYDLTVGYQGDTQARTDLPLPGPASLAQAGTITVTVV